MSHGIVARHTGNGIESKYMSVTTFKVTVKNKSNWDIAGWQWSKPC